MKKRKILIVDFNGTSSIYTHYLSNGLIEPDVDVFILGKKKPEFLDVFNITNIYLGVETKFKLLNYILNWFWLLINYRKFDGIIMQWLQLLKYSNFEVYLLAFLQKRTPLLYIVHNLYPHNTANLKIKKRYNLLYNKVQNIAVQTKNIKCEIKKLNSKARIIEIQHGLFFREFRKEIIDLKTNKCLLVGYISKYKGIEDAIKVARILKQDNVEFSLEIIGYGNSDYIEELEKMVLNYNLLDCVKFYPKEVSTKFLINKIIDASMIWLPYKNISQSGVAYTSMGLGVPFVAYNVGNFKEAFETGFVSEIVEQNNELEFSKAVVKILNKKNIYKKNIRYAFPNDLWSINKTLIKELFTGD